MTTLREILEDADQNGVYRVQPPLPDMPGVVRLDAGAWADRDAMLAAIGFALEFPDYYGVNWDALEECLFDLSWWSGPVQLLIEHADTLTTEDLVTLADVWGEAAAAWKELDRSCVLLLSGEGLPDVGRPLA